ncbi:MAG: YegP family protein [Phenylobacterium sp.]|uniref:YegP family protein n=1 Tax=Phenylobacterium sp. TaxID=1871053 RepID=UPI00391DA1DE
MAYKFEIYKDKAGEFRVRFRAANGEVMFSTEGYKAKSSAKNAIESILKNGPGAEIDDQTGA